MSTTSDLGNRAKEHAAELRDQAKAAATQEAVARAEEAKTTVASKVQQTADAADAAANQFDPASAQAQAVQQVADHIEDVATKLRTADVQKLAGQATEMARRNPLLFIGGAAIAGFAAARFLKARDPHPTGYADHTDPWGTPHYGSRAAPSEHVDNKTVMADINGDRTHG